MFIKGCFFGGFLLIEEYNIVVFIYSVCVLEFNLCNFFMFMKFDFVDVRLIC